MQGIDKAQIEKFIDEALQEDVRDGDHTSLACIPADSRSKARLLVKDPGVIAGIELAEMIFKKVDPTATLDIKIKDGSDVFYGDEAFYVECNSQALLKAERLVLNTMQRMSGIATLSSRFAVEVEGTDVTILDTRKTTPLLRFLEKWAVVTGGCQNYRDGLYDWIMIKDNNFDLPILREAVATIDKKFEAEASGGVTLRTVRAIAETGVDFISVGALTHSAGQLDLSLKVMK